MTGRAVLLILLLACVATEASMSGGLERAAICPDTAEILACPMNYVPVCGSDFVTYSNECALCVARQVKKKDIQVLRDGNC